MNKPTPGPWQVHSDAPEYADYIIGDIDGPLENGEMDYMPVCCVSETKHFEANRRLIAAAPELLAALEEARSWVSEYATQMSSYTISDKARVCLKKIDAILFKTATGEPA
jgi:hypothetical protein